MENLPTPPTTNLEIYRQLYCLETSLRELIIDRLGEQHGSRWWKQRLPEDVKEKFRKGRDAEKLAKWIYLVPHHPLYYVDFPDLKKVITKGDNWREVFQKIFRLEDVIIGTLTELEPIRNKVAHNRKASPMDLAVVSSAIAKISSAIGYEKFCEYINRISDATDIYLQLTNLRSEARISWEKALRFEVLDILSSWNDIQNQWWYDEEYLSCDIAPISDYFELLIRYSNLPRSRGGGHIIEHWLRHSAITLKYESALSCFDGVLSNYRV